MMPPGCMSSRNVGKFRQDIPVRVEAEQFALLKWTQHPRAKVVRWSNGVGENGDHVVSGISSMSFGFGKNSAPVISFQKV